MKDRNTCPVCNSDMRPASVLARLSALQEKVIQLQELYHKREREERKKHFDKAKEYWLVKIEYHV